jgi:hypothetical protein
MFEGDWPPIWQTLVEAHATYPRDLTGDELSALFTSSHPALPDSTLSRYGALLDSLVDNAGNNVELQERIIRDFWMRHRARLISELSVNIFLGKSNEFGELKRLIESSAEDSLGEKTTYTEVDMGLEELLDALTIEPDFKFEWEPLHTNVPGLDRGHFGIIFARPETGKTTFVSFLAQMFLKQGLTVAVWGNEEPAIRTKLRIIQSYFEVTRAELNRRRGDLAEVWASEAASRLHVLDCVGTTIQEIDDWCKINKPDIVFIDQLDKVKIAGKFNRGDEKLKEIYLQAREIAKRNKCLVWGVSQASAEAEGMRNVEYQYLDNSKTGKAGEADLITKYKQNSWHGSFDANIDIYRGIYQDIEKAVDIPLEARRNLVGESSEGDNGVDFDG